MTPSDGAIIFIIMVSGLLGFSIGFVAGEKETIIQSELKEKKLIVTKEGELIEK